MRKPLGLEGARTAPQGGVAFLRALVAAACGLGLLAVGLHSLKDGITRSGGVAPWWVWAPWCSGQARRRRSLIVKPTSRRKSGSRSNWAAGRCRTGDLRKRRRCDRDPRRLLARRRPGRGTSARRGLPRSLGRRGRLARGGRDARHRRRSGDVPPAEALPVETGPTSEEPVSQRPSSVLDSSAISVGVAFRNRLDRRCRPDARAIAPDHRKGCDSVRLAAHPPIHGARRRGRGLRPTRKSRAPATQRHHLLSGRGGSRDGPDGEQLRGLSRSIIRN